MVGCYRGIKWKRMRLCDVYYVSLRQQWYFPEWPDGDFGDHYLTQWEMKEAIDKYLEKSGKTP